MTADSVSTIELSEDTRQVIQAIELDAAWERAKMLEEERDMALLRCKEYKEAIERAGAFRNAYARGIFNIMHNYGPAAKAAGILAELQQLYDNPLGE